MRFDLYFEILHSQQYQGEAQRINSLHDVLKKVIPPSSSKLALGDFDAALCAATRLLNWLGFAGCHDQCNKCCN